MTSIIIRPYQICYTVALYADMFLSVKEIIYSDYSSLDQGQWVTDFLIDIPMNLINENNVYQIIPCNYATTFLFIFKNCRTYSSEHNYQV